MNAGESGPPKTSDDVVWQNVDEEDDGGLSLVPLDPKEERSRVRQRESMLTLGIADDEPDPANEPLNPQFSLKQMVIAQGVVAILLGLVRIFQPGMLAGSLGVTAMLMAAVITFYEPDDKRITVGFWCVMALYLIACVLALLLG